MLSISALFGLLALSAAPVDHSLSSKLVAIDLPGDLQKAINLSEVFAHGFGVTTILGTILYLVPTRRAAVWAAILLTAISGCLANGLKSGFVRVRPHSQQTIRVFGAGDLAGELPAQQGVVEMVKPSIWDARQRSFPSGHAATAWGLAIGLSLVFRRGSLLFACFATLACLQRLTSGSHFPSDVLAGAAIAFLSAAALMTIRRFDRATKQILAENR